MYNQRKLSKVEQAILNQLIDAYERKKSSRRTMIKAEKFDAYDLNHLDRKRLFIQAVKNLASDQVIDFKWQKYEKDNLLDTLILREEAMPFIYNALGRRTKAQRVQAHIHELSAYREQVDCRWLADFFDDEEVNIKSKSTWSSIWPKDKQARQEFVILLKATADRQEISMRYLSIRLYGDSKKLEKNYRAKLISVAKNYIPLDLEDDEILEYLGIMLNPSEVLIYGPLTYSLGSERINTSEHIYGTSINNTTIDHMKDVALGADRIMTIENKATYYEYIKTNPDNVFVVYLGGFFGRTAGVFLNLLSQLEGVTFHHWSDIDLGGFRIYRYLSQVVNKKITPVAMEANLYRKYLEVYKYTEELSPKHLEEIRDMLGHDDLRELHQTMRQVLRCKRRLEQECIEMDDVIFNPQLRKES